MKYGKRAQCKNKVHRGIQANAIPEKKRQQRGTRTKT